MGSRLEWGLLLTILAILQLDYSYNQPEIKAKQSSQTKKIASATDIKLYESNKTELVTYIEAKQLISYTNQNHYTNLRIKSPKFIINSTDATEIDNIIRTNTIELWSIDKYTTYTATSLEYHKNSGVLKLIGAFSQKSSRGVINGEELLYKSQDGYMEGGHIEASYNID